jgi:hypothetical protein
MIDDGSLANAGDDDARSGLLDRMYVTWPRPEGRDHE